jgi:hypothetical protein
MLRSICLALLISVSAAQAATPADGELPAPLSDDSMAEVVDFVVGNAVFALYHQAGHMMMERYAVEPKAGEAGADAFALGMLLTPRSGAGDQTLIDAVDSWLLTYNQTASANPLEVTLPDRHSIDADRAKALVCGMVGADPTGFSDVADAASLTPTTRAGCVSSYHASVASWDAALAPLRRLATAPRLQIAVAYDLPTGGVTAESTILRDNKVLEEVATHLADRFTLPAPPTLRAKSCGTVSSMYDAEHNELVLCYELSAYHTDLIMRDLDSRR